MNVISLTHKQASNICMRFVLLWLHVLQMGGKDFEGLIMLPKKLFYTSQITADKSIDYTSNPAGIITYIRTIYYLISVNFNLNYIATQWNIYYNSKQKTHNKIQSVSTVASHFAVMICCMCVSCRWPCCVLDFKSRFCYLLLRGIVLLAVRGDPPGLRAHLHLSQKETEKNHFPSRQWQSSASIRAAISGKSRYSNISHPHIISSSCSLLYFKYT